MTNRSPGPPLPVAPGAPREMAGAAALQAIRPPPGAGGHAPDLRAEQPPEAVRPDVDHVGPHRAPALAVGRAGGEDPQLRSPGREGIHQLADVRRPALGADDGNAAIGADVSDVRRSHADTR